MGRHKQTDRQTDIHIQTDIHTDIQTSDETIIESQSNTLATIERNRNRDGSKAQCDFDRRRFSAAVHSQ